jgi:hypothetical protein
VAKDETSRGAELLVLGWTAEEVRKYEELWEYRQRWGAINLERDERIFLRKADAALPKRQAHGKAAKKATRDKSHYRWLAFYLDALKASPPETELGDGEQGAWPILLEEELRVLDYYEPVLGLPDTLKAKALIPLREQWAGQAAALGRTLSFDFQAPLETLKATTKTSWKPLRAEASDPSSYPVLPTEAAQAFRSEVRQAITAQIRSSFPSLIDTDKPEPADDWQPR